MSIAFADPVSLPVLTSTATNWLPGRAEAGSRDRNHVFLRDMIRRMAASFHIPFETLHQGKRSAWEESRYHPQFINLICYAPFRPAGGGIDTVIYASFGELGAHT